MTNKNFLKLLDVSLFLARKSILKNKKTTILTLFIISLGFISSITIPGILRDVIYDLEENFIETSIGHIIIEPLEKKEKIEDVNNIIKKIETLPNIESIARIQKKTARLYDSQDNYIDGEVWIIRPEEFEKVSIIDDLLYEGDFINKGEKNKIFTGCSNLKSCSTAKGIDNIDVEIGKEILVSFNGYDGLNSFTLQGIYKHSFEQVEHMILINERTAENIFPDYIANEAEMIIIKLPKRELTDLMLFEISLLGIKGEIVDWKYKLALQSDTVESFGIIGTLAFLLGVFISATSIYIILHINILNKRIQIGIIKAIGVNSKIISLSYVLQALFYGIIGSIFGVFLTFLMLIYFKLNPINTSIGQLVPKIVLSNYIIVSLAIIFVSTITGYIVSKRIIKQNILESILNG